MASRRKGVERFASGRHIETYGGITAGFLAQFASALECNPSEIVQAINAGLTQPLTAVGTEDDPERFALSFLRAELEKLRAAVT